MENTTDDVGIAVLKSGTTEEAADDVPGLPIDEIGDTAVALLEECRRSRRKNAKSVTSSRVR